MKIQIGTNSGTPVVVDAFVEQRVGYKRVKYSGQITNTSALAITFPNTTSTLVLQFPDDDLELISDMPVGYIWGWVSGNSSLMTYYGVLVAKTNKAGSLTQKGVMVPMGQGGTFSLSVGATANIIFEFDIPNSKVEVGPVGASSLFTPLDFGDTGSTGA